MWDLLKRFKNAPQAKNTIQARFRLPLCGMFGSETGS
jgi:hypothetical protein